MVQDPQAVVEALCTKPKVMAKSSEVLSFVIDDSPSPAGPAQPSLQDTIDLEGGHRWMGETEDKWKRRQRIVIATTPRSWTRMQGQGFRMSEGQVATDTAPLVIATKTSLLLQEFHPDRRHARLPGPETKVLS